MANSRIAIKKGKKKYIKDIGKEVTVSKPAQYYIENLSKGLLFIMLGDAHYISLFF